MLYIPFVAQKHVNKYKLLETMADDAGQITIKTIEQPLNLIPVGLKEAALDSPTFRATALHFADQIEIIERWLDGYIKAASRLAAEVSTLEASVSSFLTQSAPPAQVSEAVLDHDYTLLALRRYGEGAREFWNHTFRGIKRYESTVIEPIKGFLNNDLRSFKEARRVLDLNQKSFDTALSRYLSQSKSKESSSLREDAFQVHEARKAYLKASMDFCVTAPNLRASLDQLLVKIFSDQFKDMRTARDASSVTFAKLSAEMERVRGWSREMENSERAFKKELLTARRQIEDSASQMTKPSRELGDYEISTVPYLGTGASTVTSIASTAKAGNIEKGEKQGWLFLKTVVGKPARTIWSRRWFYVKNGIFGWLVQGARSGGVEESEKIGVLLCGVRPAFNEERRFCFEVKTKDQSIILQAETQAELTEWIAAFDIAKKKALEDPGSTEASSLSVDPAFAITAPIAPEFAARTGDGAAEEIPGTLGIPQREDTGFGMAQRASFDVTASRRVTSLSGEPVESSRERLMSKLDIHKRSVAPPPTQSAGPAGGIASLISASHNVLPIRPDTPVTASPAAEPGTSGHKRTFTLPNSTLAPSSLANPPAPTNLSHTAVIVSGERGVSLGGKADGSGMPSGIMANLWGSSNWGYVNRLGDDLAKPQQQHQRSTSQPRSPSLRKLESLDDNSVMDGTGEFSTDLLPQTASGSGSPIGHRKTVSAVALTDTNLPGQTSKTTADVSGEQYPNYYPLQLKAQHAQFRMLFPSVPRAEKLVLVFRATWNPNEEQEFPGRVYVTEKEVYFYSNHLGLVLITGVSLTAISEVTAAPGRDCDFLYLHLKEGGLQNDRRRITIRVFLDSLRLLQRRMRFLVENANSPEPQSLEEVLKRLIKLEVEKPERSSSIESWEDLADEATGGDEGSPQHRRERNIKASLRIDGNLYGETAKTGREVQKFQLPRQPVVYSPQGMQISTTREFNVSAKALFHVIFGDKSAVFQLLYCNRWAAKVLQTPWVKNGEGTNSRWTRTFSSEDHSTPMLDTQTIDIFNDHLCYVVTNNKRPWRLPYADRFQLTTKLVITHSSKSRCKLAIFQQISWTVPPSMLYIRRLIEKQALNNLEADALDLTNVAMDQVAKLGNHSKTNKANEIFGSIGQQSSVPLLDVGTAPNLGGKFTKDRQLTQRASLTKLVAADVTVQMLRAVSLAIDVLIALGKGIIGLCTAHTLLVGVLLLSILYNSWFGYRDGLVWWHERNASKYMARVGVRPESTLTKAVYLSDIDELIAPKPINESAVPLWNSQENTDIKNCRVTFTEQVLSPATKSSSAGDRLHRSRDAMAKYRHDLLVALRVVNKVERDLVVSEWEDWVRSEERKCARVEDMLLQRRWSERKTSPTSADEIDTELGAGFGAYCASCRGEVERLDDGKALM